MKKILVCIVITSVLVMLGACNKTADKGNSTAKEGEMIVGVTPTMDCLPMILVSEWGMAERMGVPVTMRLYDAHNDIDTALMGGSVAAAFTDNIRAERLKQKGVSLIAMQHDNLDWQLIANIKQRITKTAQLKDKLTAMTRLSATERLSEAMADSAKLGDQKTFFVPINSVPLRLKMLTMGQVDAAWLPQPQASIALNAGHKRLASSRNGKDDVYGVFAVREKTRKDKGQTLSTEQRNTLKKAYNMAVDSLNRNGLGRYSEVIKRNYGITDNDIKALGKPLFRHL